MKLLRPHTPEENAVEMKPDPLGNLWITCHVRMDAHAKYLRIDRLSHILLTLYSVALLGFSVFSKHWENTSIGPYISDISVILSLSVLCASLVVWGLGFSEKARDHRDCYLALQKLYDEQSDDAEKKDRYQDILEKYPNHSGLDYERFLFRKLHIEKGELVGSSGPKTMPLGRSVIYLAMELVSFLVLAAVALSPAIVIAVIYAYA